MQQNENQESETAGNSMEYVTVSAEALRKVLLALNGPASHVRELQTTRGHSAGNPIDTLCKEYNAAALANNAMAAISSGERR